MFRSKKSLLIGCCITIIANSGCSTTNYVSRTIDSESIQAVVENPSESTKLVKAGETITIDTNKKINISSWNVSGIQMVVKDANATRIIGKIKWVCCDGKPGKESVIGNIVEVKLEDIDTIKVTTSKVALTLTAPSKESIGEFIFDGIIYILVWLWIIGI